MKLPLHISPGQSCSYLCDSTGQYLAKSISDTTAALRDFKAICDAVNLSTELPAVQVNAKLLRACELALEVIRRHDYGETFDGVNLVGAPKLPLAQYCGPDNLTDPDGVQGIGDVLREAIAEAKAQPISTP